MTPAPPETPLGTPPDTPPGDPADIRRRLAARRAEIVTPHRTGRVIAADLARVTDEALTAALGHADRPLALVATGGYGRARLAPYSDVDLLVLTAPGEAEAGAALIPTLYDAIPELSASVHDPKSAQGLAAEDMTCRTALLDARLVAGEPALFAAFAERFDGLRRGTAAAFVEAKLAERDARHAEQGNSRYAVEPDVKEGKGGMRDLDLLHWLDRYTDGIEQAPSQAVRTPGLFSDAEARRLARAQDFLWSVRVHLHALQGRADERLTFDRQPALAERLGYKDRRGATPAERLMRHYFVNATEVSRLTGSACAALEDRALKATPRGRIGTLAERWRQETGYGGDAALVRRGGRLALAEPASATPRDLFALFRAAARDGLPLHPEAARAAPRLARRVRRAERADPAIRDLFVATLREADDLERVLRWMNECGLLGRYLPAFGRIVGRTEYGLFRRYTLDEHVVQACGVLTGLRSGALPEADFPVTAPIARRLDPAPVALALLLQETGAGLSRGGQAAVARRVRAQARRLLPEAAAEEVVACVLHADLIAGTAQRRAVTERFAVEAVARVVGTQDRLDRLALVTACRHRTAGVGSWRAYKNRDARLLYEEVSAYLSGGAAALDAYEAARAARLTREARALSALPEAAMDRFLARTGPRFWSFASPAAAADLATLLADAEARGTATAAGARLQDDGSLRLVVATPDRPGVFAALAGAVAEAGGTVWGATATALQPDDPQGDAHALALVVIEALRPGTPPTPLLLDEAETEALAARLVAIAEGRATPVLPPPPITDRRAVFDVEPRLRTFTQGSPDSLIIEAEGLDRPGLLHLLARAIEAEGGSVRRAFVSTYGERAVDSFYVQTPDGRKLEDPDRIDAVRRALLAVLDTEAETDAETDAETGAETGRAARPAPARAPA